MMPLAVEILDHDVLAAVGRCPLKIVRTDRRFAVTARNVEHVSGLA
jgi:hypothetical protein